MNQEKTLRITAWVFTIAAVAAMIYSTVARRGGEFTAVLMTFALLLQYVYGREIRKKSEK